ncbi:class I SAM-dependent methyltransferase [Ferrimonas marina]|uniref:Methyltransferase domain-containing protein n=1 Tax=Ferrimonas marina TaxID=299255 RepID=A0A1M5NU70_9GAMM|nr:class I SAM-dependent methyltransferase [Ferrimonas marina]SHG93072.1 Methyltransferase domain-containing protein [Ferrimonas marina]
MSRPSQALRAYYASADEDQRLVRQNIARLEFDTTVHCLAPYLEGAGTLTELGAATGRYALYYAQQGLQVTALEPVPELVAQLRSKARQHADQGRPLPLVIQQGNAMAVDGIEAQSQDAVLVLGPLYHLQRESDRNKVMQQAKRILKPGGVLAIAYISRFFVAGLMAKQLGSELTPALLTELYQTGLVSSPKVDPFFRIGYFATPEEMAQLARDSGFTLEAHIATDGHARLMGEAINALNEDQYQAWLAHHLASCAEPSLLGASNHGLVIARKAS